MVRAVLDANVFVSALIRPEGPPGQILMLQSRTGRSTWWFPLALNDELVVSQSDSVQDVAQPFADFQGRDFYGHAALQLIHVL